VSESGADAELVEALRECRRLAEGSKDDFMNRQYRWLDSIYDVANDALQKHACSPDGAIK